MTLSHCLHHARRIGALPQNEWAKETEALPTRCEHADCTTGNCQKVCQDWLRTQFMMMRTKKRLDMDAKRGGR